MEHSTPQHANCADESVDTTPADCRETGPRAIAVDHHADAGRHSTEPHTEETRRLDVVRCQVLALEKPHADAADDNRGHHDFRYSEVAQAKLLTITLVSVTQPRCNNHPNTKPEMTPKGNRTVPVNGRVMGASPYWGTATGRLPRRSQTSQL